MTSLRNGVSRGLCVVGLALGAVYVLGEVQDAQAEVTREFFVSWHSNVTYASFASGVKVAAASEIPTAVLSVRGTGAAGNVSDVETATWTVSKATPKAKK